MRQIGKGVGKRGWEMIGAFVRGISAIPRDDVAVNGAARRFDEREEVRGGSEEIAREIFLRTAEQRRKGRSCVENRGLTVKWMKSSGRECKE